MIRFSTTHDTEAQACDAGYQMCQRYHPAGYGTTFTVHRNDAGKWICRGTRSYLVAKGTELRAGGVS